VLLKALKKRKTHNIIANTTLNDPFCLKVFLYFSLHSTFLLSLLPVRHMHQISNKAYNIKIIQQYSYITLLSVDNQWVYS